jgi:subtilisin-like proprotein convertase family protein
MRRTIVPFLVLFALFALAACSSSSDGGGVPTATIAPDSGKAALFADSDFVNYDSTDTKSEPANLGFSLAKAGLATSTFAGITPQAFADALDGKAVLAIPELENGDLDAAITDDARSVIRAFVEAGGTMVVAGDYTGNTVNLLNSTFGWSLDYVDYVTTPTAITTEAGPTRFADGPAELPDNDGTYPLLGGTLPAGALPIYLDDDSNVLVALFPRGKGAVVFLAWDWYDGKPRGSQDGGWLGVLAAAANLGRTLPDLLIPTAIASPYVDDVVAKLYGTGQFNLIDPFDASGDTPSAEWIWGHDAVFPISDGSFDDATTLGDRLADFVDARGGVVTAMFDYDGGSMSLGGRFTSDDYFAIPGDAGQKGSTSSTDGVLGTVFLPSHPIMTGVETIDGGTASYRPNTLSVVPGATRVADWDDGTPLVATRVIGGTHRADLGFYPPSSDGGNAGFWQPGTDLDRLMANALTWVAELPTPVRTGSAGFPLAIPDNTGMAATTGLTVSGGPSELRKVTVTVHIRHAATSDLHILLASPTGTIVLLDNQSGSGTDMLGTTFDDAARSSIAGGGAPYCGSFTPDNAVSAFNGEDANGRWTLSVQDDGAGEAGSILGWSIAVR